MVMPAGIEPANSGLKGRQLYQFVHGTIWYSQRDSNPYYRLERPASYSD